MVPLYLLTDPGFWFFAVLYVISVRYIVKFCAWGLGKIQKAPSLSPKLQSSVLLLFSYLLVEQFFHQAEHVTQMYQFQILGLAPTSARGFVWFLDDEWNHFIFNGLYFVGLIVVFSVLLREMKRKKIKQNFANVGFIYAFYILEGWHMVEHTYRIIHHIQGLCDQCTGILDPLTGIDRLTLHFFFNLFALLLPAVVYARYDISAEVKKRFAFASKKISLIPFLAHK